MLHEGLQENIPYLILLPFSDVLQKFAIGQTLLEARVLQVNYYNVYN